MRAKVEHPFPCVKRHFDYGKVRYRGLAKNTQRIALLLEIRQPARRQALANSEAKAAHLSPQVGLGSAPVSK